MTRAVSVVISVVVLALVVVAVLRGRRGEPPQPSRYAVVLEPGEHVAFGLSPDEERLRLVTHLALPDDGRWNVRRSRRYALDVAWIAPGGEVRRAERTWEQTRMSAWPDGAGRRRSASLFGDERLITDPRSIPLPSADVLPGGGALVVTAPDDGPAVVVRAFGTGGPQGGRPISTVDREERRRAERRVGVSDLQVLEPDERAELLDETWRTLPFAARIHEGALTRLRTDPPGLSVRESAVAGVVLTSGQSVALTLRGPVPLRVHAAGGLDRLDLSAVSDAPEDAAPLEVTWREVDPHPLPGVTEAREIGIDAPVATTVVLHNPTVEPVGPLLFTLDASERQALWGWMPALPPTLPPGLVADGEDVPWLLVGPETVELRQVRVGPEATHPLEVEVPLGAPLLRLTLRPELDGPHDLAERRATVEELDADGEVLHVEPVPVEAWPAPFERRAEDGGWVGSPKRLEWEPHPAAERIRVTATAPIRAALDYQGPPYGLDPYPLEHSDRLRVRYGQELVRSWWPLWPEDVDRLAASGQLVALVGQVRLEVRPEIDADAQRHYAALAPLGAARRQGRTWLVPGPGAFDLAWCRYPAGAPGAPLPWDGLTRSLRHGELRGYIHTPDLASLGRPYRVLLDGVPWRGGRLAQRVQPIHGLQEPRHHAAQLDAPSGTVLWLRARSGGVCPEPHRGVEAFPLGPGDVLRLPVDDTWAGRRLVLSGLADGPVKLEVALEGLGEVFPVADQDQDRAWREEVVLERTGERGQRLTDPDASQQVLGSETLRIGADVPSLVLRVQHVAGPSMWLRALVEVDELEPPRAPASARVQGKR